MGIIKIQKMKYKNINIIIRYCDYSNFEYFDTIYKNNIILYINKKLNKIEVQKILHKIIKAMK